MSVFPGEVIFDMASRIKALIWATLDVNVYKMYNLAL